MKKRYIHIIFLSVAIGFFLTACSAKSSGSLNETSSQNNVVNVEKNDETDELGMRLKKYKLFLEDEISSETQSDGSYYLRNFCNSLGSEEDGVSYALFDMTGDGMPELHVLTDISYSIHTIENDQLITWYEGDRHVRPLNNKAILEKVESTGTHYAYVVLDNRGEEVFCCEFSEGAKNTCLFSTGDETIELSKSDWDKLTKPFLTVGSDKIVWKKISDLDF